MKTPKKQEKKKVVRKVKSVIAPIHINDNVWFYPVGKRLEFCVYIGANSTLFEVPFRKIKHLIK